MSIESIKLLARRVIEEIWNERHLERFDELFAPNFVNHNPAPGTSGDLAGLKQSAHNFFAAFPDAHLSIDEVIAEGDRVVLRTTGRGTHQGTFLGTPPTGRSFAAQAYTVLRITEGQVIERWNITDVLSMLHQLGIAFPPQS
ncbi:MAG: ester cyclase [Chloroflexaceae bacterium]|nr:ester cyclase [Chloroflexaceae bacterium]